MKIIAAILVLFFVLLQYKLWLGEGSLREVSQLQAAISQQTAANAGLVVRNQTLAAEVSDLKQGVDAIEERARRELGMIKKGETFFQIVE